MATLITNEHINSDSVRMSNALFSVFIDTICLAGSSLATKPFQKDLMIWFAQLDWRISGLGSEYFDISNMIWQKKIFNKMDEMKQMIESFQSENILDTNEIWDIYEFTGPIAKYDKCSVHAVYKHSRGCTVCHNELP